MRLKKPKLPQYWKAQLSLVTALVALIAIYVALDQYALHTHSLMSSKVNFTELQYRDLEGVNIADFAKKSPGGALLLKQSLPRGLNLRIVFPATKNVTAVISKQHTKGCSGSRNGAMSLSIQGPYVNQTVKLLHGQPQKVSFAVDRGSKLNIAYSYSADAQCSYARISFIEVQSEKKLVAFAMLVMWALIAVFCYGIGASQLISILGAVFTSAMILADRTLGEIGTESLIFHAQLGLGMNALLLVFCAIPVRSKLLTLLGTILVLACFSLPLVFVSYNIVFSTPVTLDVVHAILQTYGRQAIEFWGEYAGLAGSLISAVAVTCLYLVLRQINLQKPNHVASLAVGFLLLLICAYQVMDSHDRSLALSTVSKSVASYRYEVEAFRKVADERNVIPVPAKLNPLFAKNTSVFVIGESVNKNHMSSYGYPRDTTPNMDYLVNAGDAIRFSSAYSNHTHSNPTMSLLLTQANQYNKIKWETSPSVFRLMKGASLHSTWLTSHRMLSGWSNQISALATEAGTVRTINKKIGVGNSSSQVDGELLPHLREALANARSGHAVFMHLYSSHKNYCKRYPATIDEFSSDITALDFGGLARELTVSTKEINCYDNSVFYTDQVLSEVILELDKRSEPTTLMYIADHGEDVFGGRSHNADLFTFPMSEVPMFFWANAAWKAQHSDLWENLQQNQHKVFTNDLFYETAAGLMGISSDTLEPKYDASSAAYTSLDRPTTLRGRKPLYSDNNWRYWQQKNAGAARSKGVRLAVADVDSIGKAKLALSLGIEVLEVHSDYSPEGGFQLVDTAGERLGIELSDFLGKLSSSPLKTILVRLTTAASSDRQEIQRELEQRAQRFSLAIQQHSKNEQALVLASPDFLDKVKGAKADAAQAQMIQLKTH